MADSSTTVIGIPILIAGGCWAQCQLHAGIRYVPTRSILIELLSALRRVSGPEEPKEGLGGRGELGKLYINEY